MESWSRETLRKHVVGKQLSRSSVPPVATLPSKPIPADDKCALNAAGISGTPPTETHKQRQPG